VDAAGGAAGAVSSLLEHIETGLIEVPAVNKRTLSS
jgi:hypothetical protein